MAPNSDDSHVARLQALLATLTERRFGESLAEVEAALVVWRSGGEALTAHEATVRHVERADEIMRDAIALARDPAQLVAAAVAAGLVEEADAAALAQVALPELAVDSIAGPAPSVRPSKRAVADALLARGPILVHADARRPGVAVPGRFVDETKLVLRFGYGLNPPIPDLTVDDVGISGTLVFGGVPFGCVLPWTAIFALILDGEARGMVWPEDAPDEPEVAPEPTEPEGGAGPDDDAEPPRRAKRPSHLRLVD